MTLTEGLVLVSLIAAASGVSHAHGDEEHAKKSGSPKSEQKDWGIAGDTRQARRTISMTMADAMRCIPDKLNVRHGETIGIVLKNQGRMLHEFVIGTRRELDEHAAQMAKFPNMEHDEPYMAHVPPGKTGAIVWTFNRLGEFDFACLVAGHFQAGMVGKINVATSIAKGNRNAD